MANPPESRFQELPKFLVTFVAVRGAVGFKHEGLAVAVALEV